MSKNTLPFRLALAALSLGVLATAPAAADEALFSSYETIRQALVHDTLDGVPTAARALAEQAKKASTDDPARKESCTAIAASATVLAGQADLEAVRETFAELSKAMVRYRETVSGPRPVVAFCSMAGKPWLQPDGQIGNPYYGQSMAVCGEVVSQDE